MYLRSPTHSLRSPGGPTAVAIQEKTGSSKSSNIVVVVVYQSNSSQYCLTPPTQAHLHRFWHLSMHMSSRARTLTSTKLREPARY